MDEELHCAVLRLRKAGVETPQLDAQLIMARVLGCSRLDVITHPERILTDQERAVFASLVEKRASRYPLAYILGAKEFHGVEIDVGPGVLIPRPETELLVDECTRRLCGRCAYIADIGTGSGAVAVAVAAGLPDVRVHATEISGDALKVAQANIEKHQMSDRIVLMEGNLLDPLMGLELRFDAIVSNPPYIPSREIESLEPEIKLYEPRQALDGGEDGLDVYRRLLPEALELLSPDGFLAVEVGAGQAGAVCHLAEQFGYRGIKVARDLAGIERVVVAHG